MTPRINPSAMSVLRAPGWGHATAPGRHVLQGPSRASRIADYQAAFGLPSPLHQQPLAMVVGRRWLDLLRALGHRAASS